MQLHILRGGLPKIVFLSSFFPGKAFEYPCGHFRLPIFHIKSEAKYPEDNCSMPITHWDHFQKKNNNIQVSRKRSPNIHSMSIRYTTI